MSSVILRIKYTVDNHTIWAGTLTFRNKRKTADVSQPNFHNRHDGTDFQQRRFQPDTSTPAMVATSWLLDGGVDVAVHELLDGVDQCFLGAVCAKGGAQWFEKEGGGVHLASQGGLGMEQMVAQDWGGCEQSVCVW